MAMSEHQSMSMNTDEWMTPPFILKQLGPFDTDPCVPTNRPWNTATISYTKEANGLSRQWYGRVWCNPPYGKYTGAWLKRCAEHRNAIALIFARTETKMFFEYVWKKADALLFIYRRLHFYHVDGKRARANSGAPSVLIAYGKDNAERLKNADISGAYVDNIATKEV